MKNLRILAIKITDSTDILATFTESLSEDLTINNVSIISQTNGVPDSTPLKVTVSGNQFKIICQPLTPQAAYFITFFSANGILFQSINGDAIILNDGVSNKQLILGPTPSDNAVRQYFNSYFKDNVYDLEDPSVVSKYLQILSTVLSKALSDIKQTKNENYLSFTVTDEIQVRGAGPFDRLNEESAYEIIRVGSRPSGSTVAGSVSISVFPNYPVSLISETNIENVTISTSNNLGTFNPDTLTFNLSSNPVIVVNSIIFIYNSVLSPYTYNIVQNGYQILDSKYDPNFAFTYLILANNQIKLNDVILSDPNFSLENIARVQINYQFKDLGKIITASSLSVDMVGTVGREVIPPIENIFTLAHAPIVTGNDQIGSIGDVTFIDPNALAGSGTPHPAFISEITFSLGYLPSIPGQYSVDYNTGNVYVYGQDFQRTGTGAYPPLASYSYRQTFSSNIDYVFDSDSYDLVALPNGNLLGLSANINYSYEEVFIPGIDYNADVHNEALNEFIDNRLIALNAISPLNFPVTNVFRIFNQSTGEIYNPTRWTDNKIFFSYNQAPNIQNITGERVSFQEVNNELLFVNSISSISPTLNLYKIFLNNNNVIAATEDGTGYSQNTSFVPNNTNIFIQEHYFDSGLTETQNNSQLVNLGDYQIDYVNGTVWILVLTTTTLDVGTASYKRSHINPNNSHLISVSDIYYRVSLLAQKNKSFNYVSFGEGDILPSTFDPDNEAYLQNNSIYPYQINNNQIGTFVNASFTPGVSNDIKFLRKIFEHEDLVNNIFPLDFSSTAVFNNQFITVNPLIYSEYHNVQYDGTNYYVLVNTNLPYLSPNVTCSVSIVRLSDSAQLWNSSGVIVPGDPLRFTLPGIGSPHTNDSVLVVYTFTINNLSRVIVDYNKGDYYIDYSYLADEIIISYEYGDNVLDFRQSLTVSAGEQYYVSYKVGALRDALLKNFGSLIDIPILNNLNVDFERERYRDALMAAMQSFTQGPTVASMKNIVENIVHTPPEIIESVFENWTLGNSLLNLEPLSTTGTFNLVPGKYDLGVLVNQPGQTIKFPTISNLRLAQGTMEMWAIPQWNGLDNQSNLTFKISKNGLGLLPQDIFLGANEINPQIINGSFTINQTNILPGLPNESKNGVFIYLAPDSSGLFSRWYIDVLDGYSDGYTGKNYNFNIQTNGKFYDVKSLTDGYSFASFNSGTNQINYNIINGTKVDETLTFLADYHHYFFDTAETPNNNRFSIYKDESGYLNFRIIDNNGNIYLIDSDISGWIAGQQHQIAVAWKLATTNNQDEMHLFIDGQEVANIIKYASKITPYLHEKFRTINAESIIGSITKNIVASTDLVTTAGSPIVTSSINFTANGINPGDSLYIEEAGFSTSPYTILTVNGQTLTLTTNLSITGANLNYSVNKTALDVVTELGFYKNIKVSLLRALFTGSDLQVTINNNIVSSTSHNFTTLGIVPGNYIRINQSGFANYYTIVAVNNNSLTLFDMMPSNYTNANFIVYNNNEQEIPGIRALNPAYEISRDVNNNNVLSIRDKAKVNDIVLIDTLGMNNQRIKQEYYVWGNSNNILKTKLPAPILLKDINIYHVLLNYTDIGTVAGNATLSGGILTSNALTTDQPSVSDHGRTISVYISGDNIDYTTPVTVTIHGTINGVPVSSTTLTFTSNGTQNTSQLISAITSVVVTCKPLNTAQNSVVIQIQELNPITTAEGSSATVPVIRFSYQMLAGNTLQGTVGTNQVSDTVNSFSIENLNNYLIISSPAGVAGQYQIIGVSEDLTTLTLNATLSSSFSGGVYQILNVTNQHTGLQNGYFTFEEAASIGTPYTLNQGLYLLDYYTYLSIPFELTNNYSFIGTDFQGNNSANAIIDELNILSEMLTDIRIGEIATTTESVTQDFNSLKALEPTPNTLLLCHFDQQPFANVAPIYVTSVKKYIQPSISVNSNFNKSIEFTNSPLVIDNAGILDTHNSSTIEFWVSPLVDTWNDPFNRFYFDANGYVTESVISLNNATVKTIGIIGQVVSVKLVIGDQSIDYFAGGSVSSDNQTIFLNRQLPNQQTPVTITYIPNGLNGDRISILKDSSGYLVFNIHADSIDHQIKAPVFWSIGDWHRIRAQYQVNKGIGIDQMRLFIDGYEQGDILFGNGLLFGQGQVFGSSFIGHNEIQSAIDFQDTINQFVVGSDYTQTQGAFALIDNLRISNVFRPIFIPYGESLDPNYSSNLNVVFPVTPDLYTTLLLDFDTLQTKNINFATLKNKKTGLFDITVNIFDSFDIVKENSKVQQILETLINTLKPANSQVYITYS